MTEKASGASASPTGALVNQAPAGLGPDGLRSPSEHTPGPWHRVDTADYAEIHAPAMGRQPIALVGKPEDADLIAVAPAMFDAASRLITTLDELMAKTIAERIVTGQSDGSLRKRSDEAIADLRAALAQANA